MISCPDAALISTYNLTGEKLSAPEEVADENCTLGATSSSWIVYVNTVVSPRLALTGPESVMIIVSSVSFNRSSFILIEISPRVSPDKTITVSAASVKSTPPPVAVPPVTS